MKEDETPTEHDRHLVGVNKFVQVPNEVMNDWITAVVVVVAYEKLGVVVTSS
jgi:hypothetical protein